MQHNGDLLGIRYMPSIRILVVSYSDDAVIGIADRIKVIMNSERYKELFPWVKIRRDMNNKHNLRTSHNGEFYASSAKGAIFMCLMDILTVDDPINPKEIESRAAIHDINTKFFDRTLGTRKVDKEVTPLALIMQRLAVNDPTGHLVEKKEDMIRHIVLPATDDYPVKPAELRDIYVGGLLDPARLSSKVLDESKRDLGSQEFAGQFGQSPVPFGGNIVKTDWLQVVDRSSVMWRSTFIYNAFLDTAFTADTKNDPTGMLTCTVVDGVLYIVDYWAKHLELNECVQAIVDTHELYCDIRSRVVIENKASGISINQELKRRFRDKMNVFLYAVKGKKEDRLRAFEGYLQAGRVKLIKGDWNEAFISEVVGFPSAPHDEAVDCLKMALNYYLANADKGKRRTLIY